MSGKELLEGMSYVDEGFVDEAERETIQKGRIQPLLKLLPVAACLFILLAGVLNSMDIFRADSAESELAENQSVGDEDTWETVSTVYGYDGEALEIELPEVPSVILRVETWTEDGFTGTVTQLVDTDVLEIGMVLNVVLAEDARVELGKGDDSACSDCTTGELIEVQFISYDEETGTIVVNFLEIIEEPIID